MGRAFEELGWEVTSLDVDYRDPQTCDWASSSEPETKLKHLLKS